MLWKCNIGPSQLPFVSFGQFGKTLSRSRYKPFNGEWQLCDALPTEVVSLLNVSKGRQSDRTKNKRATLLRWLF